MKHTLTLSLFLLAACGGAPSAGEGPKPPQRAADGPSFSMAPDSGKADRIGPSDGALTGDGAPDLGFVTRIDGPVSAIFIVSVDKDDIPSGEFQADTVIGESETPKELGTTTGRATSGLGVFEGDKLKNEKDGSLPPLGAGPHTLSLYVSASPAIKTGTRLRIFVQRPDKSIVGGATVSR